jgi:hypothetical protein
MPREPGLPLYFRPPNATVLTLGFLLFGCAMVYLGARQSWVLVAVICFGAAVTLLAVARMEWAILGLVAMANFDGFLKPLFAERFGLFLKDYFILLALIRWLWGLLTGEDRSSVRTGIAIPAALFMGYVISEVANPNAGSVLASLAGMRAWVMWIPLFFVAYDFLRSRVEVERLWAFATAISLVVAAYGIVQYFIGFGHLYRLSQQFRVYAASGYYTTEGTRVIRVFSTMVHPGVFGASMAFMVLAASGLAFTARRPAVRVFAVACLPVLAIGLFLSGARTAIVGLGLGAVLFLLLARRPILWVLAAVAVLVGAWQAMHLTGGALGERMATLTPESAWARSGMPLSQGFDLAWQHPFGTGVASGVGVGGFGLSPEKYNEMFLENDIGRAFGELGVGALLYVGLLVAAAIASLRAYARLGDRPASVLAAALIGALAVIGVGLSSGSALYLAPGAPYFWLALATVLRLPDLEAEEAARGNEALPEARAAPAPAR